MDGIKQVWGEFGFWGVLGFLLVATLFFYGMFGYKHNKKKGD